MLNAFAGPVGTGKPCLTRIDQLTYRAKGADLLAVHGFQFQGAYQNAWVVLALVDGGGCLPGFRRPATAV